MQQDIGHAVIRHDETKTLGDIKPFDRARDLDEVERLIVRAPLGIAAERWNHETVPECLGSEIVTHERARPAFSIGVAPVSGEPTHESLLLRS